MLALVEKMSLIASCLLSIYDNEIWLLRVFILTNFCSEQICSLENAGEGSVLPMLRSVRLVLGLFTSGKLGSVVSPHGMDAQVQLTFLCLFMHMFIVMYTLMSIKKLLCIHVYEGSVPNCYMVSEKWAGDHLYSVTHELSGISVKYYYRRSFS